MSMCASIFAIGPYSASIADLLEYPARMYATTREGSPVIARELFGIIEGSHAGRDFAKCLGISDPWDFNQHKINASQVDLAGLELLFKTFGNGKDYVPCLKAFERLREAGFDFYFRPNG